MPHVYGKLVSGKDGVIALMNRRKSDRETTISVRGKYLPKDSAGQSSFWVGMSGEQIGGGTSGNQISMALRRPSSALAGPVRAWLIQRPKIVILRERTGILKVDERLEV